MFAVCSGYWIFNLFLVNIFLIFFVNNKEKFKKFSSAQYYKE